MTKQQVVNRIMEHTKALNEALRDAWKLSLRVEVKARRTHDIATLTHIEAQVFESLHADTLEPFNGEKR